MSETVPPVRRMPLAPRPSRRRTDEIVVIDGQTFPISTTWSRRRIVVLAPPGAQHPSDVQLFGRLSRQHDLVLDDLTTEAKVAIARVIYAVEPLPCEWRATRASRCPRLLGPLDDTHVAFVVTPQGRAVCRHCALAV